MADFIEVTTATLTQSGKTAGPLLTISVSQIVSLSGGNFDAGHISLSNGKGFSTMEPYAKLKAMLGL